ncbi:class D sortase [Paenibacillus flagellatus]|uniref:Class C sortase n=1 Tax=Paenibacillus flagellatus TaxID=2211139 RepID=A0A2V5KJH0_9BACL|nr:class D sortase [Paenibacillus flagellatus]PYI50567.1 class C sortase [Paenibacillus flagellatus]
MRQLSYILIVLGIAVLASPWLIERQADREQQRLLQEAEQGFQLEDDVITGYARLSRLLEEEPHEVEPAAATFAATPPTADSARSDAGSTENVPVVDGKQPLALIEIASIDLKLPVLEGATQANMKVAAAHMTETDPIGAVGNAAIAAHRARTKGRQFNRLDEVKVGDDVVIRTAGETYVYTVYRTAIVEPTDLSVLERDGDERILTLITCDPVVNATHRLIVQAKIGQPKSEQTTGGT